MTESFRETIQRALSEDVPIEGLVTVLRYHRDRGLSQQQAYEILEALRVGRDEATEDRILEIMDIVSGFCGPQHRVWSVDDEEPDEEP